MSPGLPPSLANGPTRFLVLSSHGEWTRARNGRTATTNDLQPELQSRHGHSDLVSKLVDDSSGSLRRREREESGNGQARTLRHGGGMRGSSGGGDHGAQRADATQEWHTGGGNEKAYPLWGVKQPVCPSTNVRRGSLGGTQIYPPEKCHGCMERGETSRQNFVRGSTQCSGGVGSGGMGCEASFCHCAS